MLDQSFSLQISKGMSTQLGLMSGSMIRAKNSAIQWPHSVVFAQDGQGSFVDLYSLCAS